MTTDAQPPARPGGSTTAAGSATVRRGSLAVLVLLVAEYGIGMYVNLYATIPRPTTAPAWAARSATGRRYSASTP